VKLSKAYEPKDYEPEIYALWEASGAFAPSGQGEPYSIVMPPPNANGNLHVGHAYMIPIEDILARYHRMRGYDTVWIPGADHAGFETWVVFEKTLEREGKSRFDFSRDELYQMTWDFVAQNRHNMELQLRALGASCDWGALVFTLDPKVISTVYQTFKKLWDDGLVYRGERIVNYCTVHQTSFADIEIVFKEENSHLWQIAYPLSDGKGEIVVATTRPETMLGDVAVAVHPDDKRYAKLVGKTVKLPLTDREIPIIADEAVEQEFGTGAVKVTPAHDPLDFEIGQRHQLENITIIDRDGLITDAAPAKYRGLTIDISREDVIKDLQQQGYLRKTEHYKHQVPHCYKCDSVIQPLLMKQWFLNVKPLAERAKQAIRDHQIKFVPEQKGRELVRYYDELRDWNISRQIPWGIPIPAFQNVDNPDDWIFDTRVDQAEITVDGKTYRRDEDTFDTWFSSGQWPIITTDYLTQGELARFYPTSVMETGVDILRPWVSRMVMFGLYITDKVPFRDVFFHGLVLDEHGVKMSKSKGNVINPMGIIDEYGSDALRIGIVMNRSAGQAQAFSIASVVAGRNFCNKLWNIARFIESKEGSTDSETAGANNLADHWILRQLDNARKTVDKHIKNYRFAEAVETIYHTVWDDLADWFIEASKTNARPEFLRHVLDITLRLTHSFAPFVTETIWTTLHDDNTLVISQQWPTALSYNKSKAAEFDQIKELVSNIRLVTTELPAGKYDLTYEHEPLINDNSDLIAALTGLKSVRPTKRGRGMRLATINHTAWLDIDEQLLYEHQTRLETRLAAVREEIANLEKRLASGGYVAQAPKHLVEETKRQLDEKRAIETRLMIELNAE
jgi:valyl-tRNA synthetase